MSQQMLPLAGDNYAMNTSDLTGPGSVNGCGSTAISAVNNQNSNPTMNPKSRNNHGMLNQTSLPAIQHAPQLRPQMIDGSQTMNFQPTHSTREQLLQSQQFQHQQFQQSNNQPSVQSVQNQRYQYNQQHQQLIANPDNIKHFPMPSNFSGQLLPADGVESTSESLLPHVSEQFHVSELQTQYQKNTSSGNPSKGSQLLGQIQGPQDVQALSSSASQKIWKADQQNAESQNELSCLFAKSQADALSKENWYSLPPQKSLVKEKLSFDQKEFHQRMAVKDEAQPLQTCPDPRAFVASEPSNKMFHVSNREQDYLKQKRWLLLLLHSRKCPSPKGQCKEVSCIKVQELWMHIDTCNSKSCIFPRCSLSRKLFNHYMNCKVADCPVCAPVQQLVASVKVRNRTTSDTGFTNKMNGSWKNVLFPAMDKVMSKAGLSPCETSDCQQPSMKRLKVQSVPFAPKMEEPVVSAPTNQINFPMERQSNMHQQVDASLYCKTEAFEATMDTSLADGWCPLPDPKLDVMSKSVLSTRSGAETCSMKEAEAFNKMEMEPVDKDTSQTMMEINQEANMPSTDPAAASKSGKPKIKGVSMTELFSVEQVRDHIISLRQWVGQVR